jgi:hypothetical protein
MKDILDEADANLRFVCDMPGGEYNLSVSALLEAQTQGIEQDMWAAIHRRIGLRLKNRRGAK